MTRIERFKLIRMVEQLIKQAKKDGKKLETPDAITFNKGMLLAYSIVLRRILDIEPNVVVKDLFPNGACKICGTFYGTKFETDNRLEQYNKQGFSVYAYNYNTYILENDGQIVVLVNTEA